MSSFSNASALDAMHTQVDLFFLPSDWLLTSLSF